MKKYVIFSFFIIERVFIRGIHRKDKNIKTVFESIPIPKYAFSFFLTTSTASHENCRFLENKNENPVLCIVNRGNICVLNKMYLFENSETTLSRAHQHFVIFATLCISAVTVRCKHLFILSWKS